jgi:hypothetical protein
MGQVKSLLLYVVLGVGPLAIIAQATGSSTTSEVVPWFSTAAVVSLAGLIWKIQNERIKELKEVNGKLTDAANKRADEDRRLAMPLLTNAIQAQASYIDKRLNGVIEER